MKDKSKNDVPFDPPYTKEKSGDGYSIARYLARQAMNKQIDKMKKPAKESRKSKIVKQASKDAKRKAKEKPDDFQKEPTLDNKTSN